MKILVIGKGGREHALAWKMAQSPLVSQVYVAPGSPGMEFSSPIITSVPISESENEELVNFALENGIGLTVIGPETSLMNGLADDFSAKGLSVFGPSKASAQIEGSKEFAKELMLKYKIPTAAYAIFSEYEQALTYLKNQALPIVVKYDGLAAGKGVVVAHTREDADEALKMMLVEKRFGKGKVIIEEFLEGPEFSLMALVNGKTVIPLAAAQDHKRAFDGDTGPNTGGMGAYTPVPFLTDADMGQAMEEIMMPAAHALVEEGIAFTGVLYGGLILTSSGPKVIEFNARFGDPETEVILPKMKSDLVQHLIDILAEKDFSIEWHDRAFLGVVMASKGYPGGSSAGIEIKGLEKIENTVFHMGTTRKGEKWFTDGGRVLFVVGDGRDLQEARNNAYRAVSSIDSEALFYRMDIGYQAL